MLTEVGLLESIDLTPLIFLWVWMKIEVYKIKTDTQDELSAGLMDAAAAAHIKKLEEQLRRKKSRSLHRNCKV